MNNLMKAIVSWTLYFLILFVGVIFCWEAWLRVRLYQVGSAQDVVMFEHVHERIAKIWRDGYKNKKIFWGPPYQVFLNEGSENRERMDRIHKYSILPKSGSWKTPNFLRSENEVDSSSYTVTTNSMGFRGREYSKEKGKNVFRIIVLGSYPAFGSGVNDDETYAAYLEKYLNEESKDEITFEVWNGGRQGITAISGLARLQNEILNYSPDLLIWDFGWVDFYFGEDFVENKGDSNYVYSWKQRSLQWIWRNLTFLISSRKIYHTFNANFRKKLLGDWREINSLMVSFAKRNNLPVVLLRQRAVIADFEEYLTFTEPKNNIHAIDFKRPYNEKRMIPTEAMKNEFWSSLNWLSESGYTKSDEIMDRYYFQVDAVQLNKYAHSYVAKELKSFILREIINNEK